MMWLKAKMDQLAMVIYHQLPNSIVGFTSDILPDVVQTGERLISRSEWDNRKEEHKFLFNTNLFSK